MAKRWLPKLTKILMGSTHPGLPMENQLSSSSEPSSPCGRWLWLGHHRVQWRSQRKIWFEFRPVDPKPPINPWVFRGKWVYLQYRISFLSFRGPMFYFHDYGRKGSDFLVTKGAKNSFLKTHKLKTCCFCKDQTFFGNAILSVKTTFFGTQPLH